MKDEMASCLKLMENTLKRKCLLRSLEDDGASASIHGCTCSITEHRGEREDRLILRNETVYL